MLGSLNTAARISVMMQVPFDWVEAIILGAQLEPVVVLNGTRYFDEAAVGIIHQTLLRSGKIRYPRTVDQTSPVDVHLPDTVEIEGPNPTK